MVTVSINIHVSDPFPNIPIKLEWNFQQSLKLWILSQLLFESSGGIEIRFKADRINDKIVANFLH